MNIREIRRRNHEAGGHFFDPETMRFFRSRVVSRTRAAADARATFFVTSDVFPDETEPYYTVRRFDHLTATVRPASLYHTTLADAMNDMHATLARVKKESRHARS